ncbi:MAG: chemotaxis-specific protein-glutamate methyltransferase CheB [Chitinivibrionales bacterium]|nr:chemotaxis-specific protein-glutamate methyltransferase CheB [Chitinivibrionales bacterium]
MSVRVLIVDDSPVVREILRRTLDSLPQITVVGTARDPYVARDRIYELNPDVITLDLEMPRMDGLTFLRKLMHHHPLPVVVVSSVTADGSRQALAALEAGAVDVIEKPGPSHAIGLLSAELGAKIRSAAQARVVRIESSDTAVPLVTGVSKRRVVAMGASTGGTVALQRILTALPPDAPGVLVAQHMPAYIASAFAERLDSLCAVKVAVAEDGCRVRSGEVLVAAGGAHLLLRRDNEGFTACVKNGPPVRNHRPSVDVLFESVAQAAGPDAVGVLLTGMGSDGAEGLLAMRNAGAHTIAQDEASCVVFGMPREAIRLGAVDEVLPLPDIAAAVLRAAAR